MYLLMYHYKVKWTIWYFKSTVILRSISEPLVAETIHIHCGPKLLMQSGH